MRALTARSAEVLCVCVCLLANLARAQLYLFRSFCLCAIVSSSSSKSKLVSVSVCWLAEKEREREKDRLTLAGLTVFTLISSLLVVCLCALVAVAFIYSPISSSRSRLLRATATLSALGCVNTSSRSENWAFALGNKQCELAVVVCRAHFDRLLGLAPKRRQPSSCFGVRASAYLHSPANNNSSNE